MLQDRDAAAFATGFWPGAVLSGHAYSYRRFTRTLKPGTSGTPAIAYMVVGNGGHGLDLIRPVIGMPIPVPYVFEDTTTASSAFGGVILPHTEEFEHLGPLPYRIALDNRSSFLRC